VPPDSIQHVVVLMLENHSFDEMLGCMTRVYPGLVGVDPNHPATNPNYPTGPAISQAPKTARTIPDDPQHDLDNVLRQIGSVEDPKSQCQGFVSDFAHKYPTTEIPERSLVMGYYDLASEPANDSLPVLHTLARNFTVCDHWFSSMPGPTWPNRFFVHSGTCLGHVLMPSGIFHPNLHLYDQTTIFNLLQDAGISWEIYYGDFPQTLVMMKLWAHLDHYHAMNHFAQKALGPEKDFPQYCFIEPTYFGSGQNDEHPPTDVWKGEALVATVYNTICKNAALWNSTLLIVLYDEHGGFFDRVFPLPAIPPDSNTKEYSFAQYGVRVPALLISPWVAAGVDPTVYDHTSLLKYLVEKWNLPPDKLGARTSHSTTNSSAPKLLPNPRTDAPAQLPVPMPAVQPMDEAPAQPPTLTAHAEALVAFSHYLELLTSSVEPDVDIVRRTIQGVESVAAHGAVAIERARNFIGYRLRGLI
jgi:phospholipase C